MDGMAVGAGAGEWGCVSVLWTLQQLCDTEGLAQKGDRECWGRGMLLF